MVLKLNLIFLLILAQNVLAQVKDPSYLEQIKLALFNGVSDRAVQYLGFDPDCFSETDSPDNKYNDLHSYKFSAPELLQNCIKFHDSEVVSVDLIRLNGRWDRHIISTPMTLQYEYAIAEYNDKEDVCRFHYKPWGYLSIKGVRNNTKMLRSVFVYNEMLGVTNDDDEAMIDIDYDKYFFKYSCVNAFGRVSAHLHFQLRPEATAQLDKNPNLFAQILDSIPEKTLNKIKHLIPKLRHQKDDRFSNFGQDYYKTLMSRLDKYYKDNQLSDKSDDQVFQFLAQNCLNFKDQQIFKDLSKIASINWRLDSTDSEIGFNRISSKQQSDNSFSVSLFKDRTLLAYSDQYYDPNVGGFWTFTEGRRAFEAIIFSNDENRVSYICEERQINGKLQIKEKLRYFTVENSANIKSTKPQNFDQFLSQSISDSKILKRINQLRNQIEPVDSIDPVESVNSVKLGDTGPDSVKIDSKVELKHQEL